MSEFPKEKPSQNEGESKLHTTFSLMDFRAGHWPGTKTPPWLLNEMWELNNPEWRAAVKTKDWQKGDELLVGSGIIQDGDQTHEVDIYARRDLRRGADYFGLAAYPKGKHFTDFWDEEGREKNVEDEE
ncbi:hypothetical protein HYW17_04905 [Candidatus Uhrbacteria bacterium]|nr:hypothetical protein [Candidatus Uhrbacteria bacterium]